MKSIGFLGLALVAVFVLNGMGATTSMAICVQVEEENTGNYNNSECREPKTMGKWIKVKEGASLFSLGNGQWCAETEEPNTGNYNNSECREPKTGSKWIKIKAEAPHWYVNGSRLLQGKKAVNISAAQVESELKGKVALLGAWISCKSAITQNAYIEGSGTNQGQDSASNITFEKCTTHEPAKCIVNEPIKTKQIKSQLVEYTNNSKQTKIGDLFEPSQGEIYVEISFKKGVEKCAIEGEVFPVKGSVVANIFPENQEVLNGHLTFPKEPITVVKHEGQERKVGLTLGGGAATFSGIFEAKLVSGEKWGVFAL
jgi:hypothetical protein